MKKVIKINKPIGMTPLQLVQKFKADSPEYKNIKIGYAGRLDPLACGKMLLLVGDENKNRQKYLQHDKIYITEILLGIKTDSYDLLGLPKRLKSVLPKDWLTKTKSYLKSKVGKSDQFYPPYSTKTVKGKPLFKWTKEGKLNQIQIPSRKIEIYSIELISTRTINSKSLLNTAVKRINLIEGDFRQDAIINAWKELLTDKKEIYQLVKIKVDCSTGTYIRSLANDLGENLGSFGLAFSINRTKIYHLK